jgi:hypothetical protein
MKDEVGNFLKCTEDRLRNKNICRGKRGTEINITKV